jgi:hypothetical protein
MKKIILPMAAVVLFTAFGAFKTGVDHTLPNAKNLAANNHAAVGTLITVKLTGGANAGSYTATSATPTCSMGLTGAKSFGNQYSVSGKKDNEFSSLQLIVDDYAAAKSGTTKFYIKVAFGKQLMGNAYIINGSDNSLAGAKEGTGKLTVRESGGIRLAHIEGTTKTGVAIVADLTCYSVVTQ